MSEYLTVTYAGLNADEMRVVINDKRAVGLRHGCAITELRALDRTARELQDTCHKQAQRIAVLEQAARQALEALELLRDGLCGPKHVPNAITALREALETLTN